MQREQQTQDRFWMVQADGDMFSWYKAHAHGLDVKISDPNVWVSQIQGPRSIEVLNIELFLEELNFFACSFA